MPYINDFEGKDPLASWDYNPEYWRIITEGGNQQLQGRSGLNNVIEVLGNEVPQWQTNDGDLAISLRMRLTEPTSGGRILFQFSDQGYYALEVFSGLISLRRGAAGQHTARSPERIIRSFNAPIQYGQWYEYQIWVEGPRIAIYLNKQLFIRADDSAAGALPPGSILFQTVAQQQGIDLDDLKIEQPLSPSEHFEGASFPSTWTRSNSFNVTLASDPGQGQYVRVENEAEIRPVLPPLADVQITARLHSIQGGLQILLRESLSGVVVLNLEGGNLTTGVLGPERQLLSESRVSNFYGRDNWFDLVIQFVGDRLFIYRNGALYFEKSLPDAPLTGGIAFISRARDIFQLDDILFTEIERSSAEDAQFAFEALNALAARPIQDLLNDWYEFFDDPLRTRWWWEGGAPGPGEYVSDPTQPNNQTYYRMTYLDRPTWRLLREAISEDRTIFGSGQDRRNFNDSSDFYARVLVRLEGIDPGAAWLGVRSRPTITGANLDQYRFDLIRAVDGTYQTAISLATPVQRQILYQGELPQIGAGTWPEWTELVAVALDDRIAFFANGRLVHTVIDSDWLGGAVAIGVEPGSTADFDDLIIRDTSPRPR